MLRVLIILLVLVSPALSQESDSAEKKLKLLIGELMWNNIVQGQQVTVQQKQIEDHAATIQRLYRQIENDKKPNTTPDAIGDKQSTKEKE